MDEGGLEEGMGRLGAESALVDRISYYPQRENRHSEAIAGVLRVPSEELREDFIVVFLSRSNIPERRVEYD